MSAGARGRFGGRAHYEYVCWCPECDEWCDFEDKPLATKLAENHDENFHNGQSVSVVLRNRNATDGGDSA